MRIAIITFHRAYNCGAMLQAWALKTVLERMGHHVEFPFGDYNQVGCVPWRSALSLRSRNGSLFRRGRSFAYRLLQTWMGKGEGVRAGRLYDAFRIRNLPERQCEIADFAKYYDAVVLGSDQVINPRINGWTSYFLCRSIQGKIPRIAYAASVGDGLLSEKDTRTVVEALSSFRAVSVRERFQDYAVNLDPVLLLSAKDFDEVAVKCRKRYFLYMYCCEAKEWEIEVAQKLAARLGLGLVITPTWGRYKRENDKRLCDKISPGHMVGYIKSAKYVLAGSFHGTALALLHDKPVLNLRPQVDGHETRITALLGELGESDRVVNPSVSIDEMASRLVKPYGAKLCEELGLMRERALKWIRNSIKSCE